MRVCLYGIAATVCLCTAIPGICGPPVFRTVALTGDPAPGTPEGVNFTVLGTPSINAAGDTAFDASVSDFMSGVWSEGSGALELVARFGDPAPGTPDGVTFFVVSGTSATVVLNEAGAVTFHAFLDLASPDVTFGSDTGLWTGGAGSLSLVAREGDPAPGLAEGTNFGEFNTAIQPVLNPIDGGAFRNLLTGNTGSVWSGDASSQQLIAMQGQPAAGTEDGVVFGGSFTLIPVYGGGGHAAFKGNLSGPGVDGTNSTGLWSGSAGALDLVARAGDQAPGLPTGLVYSLFVDPVINDFGQTAFSAFVSGPGVDGSNDGGVWSEGSGSLALVARDGAQAPGTPAGVTHLTLTPPMINGLGQVVFEGALTGPGVDASNDFAIWSQGSGALQLAAREGDQAPGTADGVVFGQLFDPVLNGAGHIAFRAGLSGPGVTAGNDTGLWAEQAPGVLSLVVREGDALEVAPGDVRTLGSLDHATGSGGQDGRPTSFNDAGQLAVLAIFTDNSSGVLVFGAQNPPGDLTGDGVVDASDLGALLGSWGPAGECPPPPPGDLNGDCVVDAFDLAILLGNWT